MEMRTVKTMPVKAFCKELYSVCDNPASGADFMKACRQYFDDHMGTEHTFRYFSRADRRWIYWHYLITEDGAVQISRFGRGRGRGRGMYKTFAFQSGACEKFGGPPQMERRSRSV